MHVTPIIGMSLPDPWRGVNFNPIHTALNCRQFVEMRSPLWGLARPGDESFVEAFEEKTKNLEQAGCVMKGAPIFELMIDFQLMTMGARMKGACPLTAMHRLTIWRVDFDHWFSEKKKKVGDMKTGDYIMNLHHNHTCTHKTFDCKSLHTFEWRERTKINEVKWKEIKIKKGIQLAPTSPPFQMLISSLEKNFIISKKEGSHSHTAT